MKFTIVLTAFVAVAMASPAIVNTPRDVDNIYNVDNVDNIDETQLCKNIKNCVSSLAHAVTSCAKAIADEGKNLEQDAKCVKDAVKAGISAPSACKGCL